MSVQFGPTLGQSAESRTGGTGTRHWSNPGRMLNSDDASRASVGLGTNEVSHRLTAWFDLSSIPATSWIRGIQARLRHRASMQASSHFINANVFLFNDQAQVVGDHRSTGSWPTTLSTDTLGGSADTWGLVEPQRSSFGSQMGVYVVAWNNSGIYSITGEVAWLELTLWHEPPKSSEESLALGTAETLSVSGSAQALESVTLRAEDVTLVSATAALAAAEPLGVSEQLGLMTIDPANSGESLPLTLEETVRSWQYSPPDRLYGDGIWVVNPLRGRIWVAR